MVSIQDFLAKFSFDERKSLYLGVERECFLVQNTEISPIAQMVLNELGIIDERFSYELSACQLEDKTKPCTLDHLKEWLLINEKIIKKAEEELEFSRSFKTAPVDMPLDIYPDPRYQEIAKKMSREVLLAACRIIATQFHIGMPNMEDALKVYNEAIKHVDELCKLGNDNERLEIYKIVKPNLTPPHYRDCQAFYEAAKTNNFVENPRNCWHLIRISIHGTIEFRMFPAVENLDTVVKWAKTCHDICKEALG